MLERLLLVVVLMGIGYIIYRAYTQYQLKRLRYLASSDPLIQRLRAGVPAIIYFTSPICTPCRFQQQPALLRLQADMGEDNIQIIKIDVSQDPLIADRWGVLSAPTTFLFNRSGEPIAVNHGIADEHKLKRQIESEVL